MGLVPSSPECGAKRARAGPGRRAQGRGRYASQLTTGCGGYRFKIGQWMKTEPRSLVT